MTNKRLRRVAVAQGLYYAITGVWPLVSLRTFEAITGPKRDKWLVRTVGVLVAVIGTGLACAGRRGSIAPEVRLIGIGSALGLSAIDIVYAAPGRIARTYLLDALIELALVLGWLRNTRAKPVAEHRQPRH